ncbi:MAG: glycosyltransferase family 4 protein, partial [Pirellulales bacterium]
AIRQRRVDLLHANSLAMGRLTGPVAQGLGLPSIAHLRDIIGLSKSAIGDLNCHNRLLAVSHATRAYHVAAGLAPDRVHVLYNGVDLDRFRPRPPTGWLHRELDLPPSTALIGFVGQIALRKGLDTLLEAAHLVAATSSDVHFLVVGQRYSEKPESRELEARVVRAAREELSGRLYLLGERTGVERLLPELAILVHPARQEPLGRVLLEAAASGTPIIATRVGGTEEIFPASASAAQLVPPGDALTLADAIQTLLANPQQRATLATAGRQRAEAAFDIRRSAAALIQHYREVAARAYK